MPELMTTKQFAQAVGCSRPCVSNWVGKGVLTPADRHGHVNLFSQAQVERMKAYYNDKRRKKGPVRNHRTRTRPTPEEQIVTSRHVTDRDEDGRDTNSPVKKEAPAPEPVTTNTAGDRWWNRGRIDRSVDREVLRFGPIELPVIRDNVPAAQARVPSVDKNFHVDIASAVVIANALRNAEPTWVWGPSGSGKTSETKQLCAMLNWPFYRVNMTADFTVADFVGQTKVVVDPTSGQAVTTFVDGVLISAMLNGGVLLIDEVTATPAGVLMALQAILERDGGDLDKLWRDGESWCAYVNTENGGEVVHAHPRFRIVVTDNTNGQGDVSGAFSGTNVMNEAFRSRFTQWFLKEYPNEADWVKILIGKTKLSTEDARKVVKIARDVNSGSALLGAQNVTNESVINPRDTLAIARLFSTFEDIVIAFNTGLLNGMHADSPDRQFIADLVRNREG